MKILGKDLIFISQINRDGSGVHKIEDGYLKVMQEEMFKVRRLSLSENTYIATNFNSFVVRFKDEPPEKTPIQNAWVDYMMNDKNYKGNGALFHFQAGWKAHESQQNSQYKADTIKVNN